ncbi:MAG TPA: folylpolyglutamate synthase/dihydrofolate synthase family protein [Pirellulales bacterium]|jgi:dihydrofolate synthase/folylpolyglutamate synthase|nr:folylpolyglutamate synthase/dihydrofolate synthase family protein [Pirellulales bacterium]
MQRRTSRPAGNPALDFLLSRIDYERTSAVSYDQRDFRLDRMRQLLGRLGNPQDALRIVHIAGTKGKGSTAATIAAILEAAGLRTGLYSSPHLDRVEERLMIDRAFCPADELIDLVHRVQPAVTAMDAEPTGDPRSSNRPTYFEIITALALVRFAEHRVDAAVLEVGLGGRLDSTNVCQPLVSVITSISLDHTQQLGNTLAAIAAEKAGIIKPATPVVSGVVNAEPRGVVADVARRHHCRLAQLGTDFDFTYRPPRNLETAPARGQMDFSYRVSPAEFELENLELNLAGTHQAANAAVAIATVAELRRQGWDISDAAIRQGLAQVRWPARIEVFSRHPTVVLDAAHNVASIEALVRVLDESFSVPSRVLVFATTRDKDVRGMLRVLLPKFEEVILTRYWNNPRAMPPAELDELAGEISSGPRHCCDDAAAAWKLATRLTGADHLICITGSFFIAAEMRGAMQKAAESNLDSL